MPRVTIPIPVRILMFVVTFIASAQGQTRLQFDPVAGQLSIQVDSDAPKTLTLDGPQIIPIQWHRQGRQSALLPIACFSRLGDLVLFDQQRSAYTVPASNVLPEVGFEPQAYAAISHWHGQPPPEVRRRYIGFSILFSLGFLLTLLARRHQTVLATSYCVAFTGLLGLSLSARPALHTRDDAAITWYYAAQQQTVRIDITIRSRWIPIFESMDHLRSVNPRIEVVGDQAQIVFDLKESAVVGLRVP